MLSAVYAVVVCQQICTNSPSAIAELLVCSGCMVVVEMIMSPIFYNSHDATHIWLRLLVLQLVQKLECLAVYCRASERGLSLIHISEPTRPY